MMWESHLRASIKRLLLARIGGGESEPAPGSARPRRTRPSRGARGGQRDRRYLRVISLTGTHTRTASSYSELTSTSTP
jgi:hypothetical protein